MNSDKIGTQTCYIHQCTNKGIFVDAHSMSVSQSCLSSFLCNPLQISRMFYLLVEQNRKEGTFCPMRPSNQHFSRPTVHKHLYLSCIK